MLRSFHASVLLAAFLPCATPLLGPTSGVAAGARPIVIRVDPAQSGRAPDIADGSSRRVPTLSDALALVDTIRATRPGANVAVEMPPGVTRLDATFTLQPSQGGDAAHPLVIRGAPERRSVLSGSQPLHPLSQPLPAALAHRLPEAARAHVRLYRLPAALASRPPLVPSTLEDRPEGASLEIYDGRGALVPARWPPEGWASVRVGAGTDDVTVPIPPDQAARWRDEPDLWAEGYWRHGWLFESLPVARVGAAALTLMPPRLDDPMHGPTRIRIVHALSELAAPGQWWLERATGLLVAWPRDPAGELEVGATQTLLRTAGASHLRIEDLAFEHALGDAIVVHDGEDVVLHRVGVASVGGRGVVFDHALSSGIEGGRVADTGGTGVSLIAGDRTTLTPGGLFLRNSSLSGFGRLILTQRAGVELDGVGATVEGDSFSGAGTLAIWIRGNDHRIVANEFFDLLKGATDGGAVYSGRDWTARGTLIARNFFHDLRADPGFEDKGIYLDDFASGYEIRDNLFLRVDQPVFIGGGRDNIVAHNLFVASSPAVHVDSRGETWDKVAVNDPTSELRRRYAALPVASRPWSRYGRGLRDLLEDNPQKAEHNRIEGNVSVLGQPFDFSDGGDASRQILSANVGPDGIRLADGEDLPVLAAEGRDPKAFSNLVDAEGRRIRAMNGRAPGPRPAAARSGLNAAGASWP